MKKPGRPSKKPYLPMLLMQYETTTAKQLAEEYGVTISTVRRWIKEARNEGINQPIS